MGQIVHRAPKFHENVRTKTGRVVRRGIRVRALTLLKLGNEFPQCDVLLVDGCRKSTIALIFLAKGI